MIKNKAFFCGLNSLLHPVSIGAILLLLINDHWLRHVSPSWWTGKIGDFSWLVFAPFICALVIAWLVPSRFEQQTKLVGLLSILIIGVWFTTAKTIPAVHALTTTAWEAIIGWHGTQRLDPTDLITLPALFLSWYIWQRAARQPIRHAHYAWALLALGVVATLGSDGPENYIVDPGVNTICQQNGELRFYNATQGQEESFTTPNDPEPQFQTVWQGAVYASKDGGLTWAYESKVNFSDDSHRPDKQPGCSTPDQRILQDQTNTKIQFRWNPGQSIEKSADGGQTWNMEFDLYQLRQDVRKHHKPISSNDMTYESYDTSPGPRSGLIDTVTGNVILAMGWDGVLTRTTDGVWHWVAVVGYKLDTLSITDAGTFLSFEWWLAGALIVLVLSTAASYLRQTSYVVIGIGWIGWLIVVFVLLPPYQDPTQDNFAALLPLGLLSLGLLLLAIPKTVRSIWVLLTNFRYLFLPVVGVGILTAIMYLIPYLLWTIGTVPRYVTAASFAVLLTEGSLLSGYHYLRGVIAGKKGSKLPPVVDTPEAAAKS